MAAEGLDYDAHLPDEDAGVPEELAALYECLRQLQIGLLGEALDAADDVVVRLLDISVSRIWTAGLDADGHQGVVAVGKFEALAYDGMEIGLVEDEVVGRRDDHLRLGVDLGAACRPHRLCREPCCARWVHTAPAAAATRVYAPVRGRGTGGW